MIKEFLQIGRVQTFPASLCLVMVALLAPSAVVDSWLAAAIFPLVWLLHFVGFGLNSYLDTAMRYDIRDPAKRTHPLVSRKVSLSSACRVLNWGACLAVLFAAIVTLRAQNPTLALVAFLIYTVFGYAYDCGLSKESLWGFGAISISFAALAAWAWFLSHETIGTLGWVLISYVFFTILFQISWSGFIKEMGVRERSNLLIRLGASLGSFFVSGKQGGRIYFVPGNSIYYGWAVKIINLFLGGLLLYLVFSWQGLVSLLFFGSMALYFLHQLTKRREYVRDRELVNMSAMEIATIFLPISITVPVPALALMIFGVAYFWVCNKVLWGVSSHPRV